MYPIFHHSIVPLLQFDIMMNPTNDNQTSTQSISRALCNLDNDLRQILILYNGNGNTPGLSFEALTDRLERPIQDLITAEKTAITSSGRLWPAQTMLFIKTILINKSQLLLPVHMSCFKLPRPSMPLVRRMAISIPKVHRLKCC